MLTKKTNDIEFTVRAQVGMDVFDKPYLLKALGMNDGGLRQNRAEYFVDCLIQTVEVKGLPFEWPATDRDADDLQKAYEHWCDLPPLVVASWANAIFEINNGPGEAEDKPGED
jgi:hypothetical protein